MRLVLAVASVLALVASIAAEARAQDDAGIAAPEPPANEVREPEAVEAETVEPEADEIAVDLPVTEEASGPVSEEGVSEEGASETTVDERMVAAGDDVIAAPIEPTPAAAASSRPAVSEAELAHGPVVPDAVPCRDDDPDAAEGLLVTELAFGALFDDRFGPGGTVAASFAALWEPTRRCRRSQRPALTLAVGPRVDLMQAGYVSALLPSVALQLSYGGELHRLRLDARLGPALFERRIEAGARVDAGFALGATVGWDHPIVTGAEGLAPPLSIFLGVSTTLLVNLAEQRTSYLGVTLTGAVGVQGAY